MNAKRLCGRIKFGNNDLAERHRCFKGTCCLYLQGWRERHLLPLILLDPSITLLGVTTQKAEILWEKHCVSTHQTADSVCMRHLDIPSDKILCMAFTLQRTVKTLFYLSASPTMQMQYTITTMYQLHSLHKK